MLEGFRPFLIDPKVTHSLLSKLYKYDPMLAAGHMNLFAKHLTGVLQPMNERELEVQRENDRQLQQRLRSSGFDSGDQTRKRSWDDEDDNVMSP